MTVEGDMTADESSLGSYGKLDALKIGLVLYESFTDTYLSLGERGKRPRAKERNSYERKETRNFMLNGAL